MIALSFTRAELARNCKFAFNQRYILKTPEAESPALQGGGLFHDWAEQYGISRAQDGAAPRDLDKAARITSEVPDGIPYEVYDDIRKIFLWWAEKTVLEFPDKMRFETRMAFNQAWEPVDWMAEDVLLRMMIDRIDFVPDPTRIVDYKTARALQEAKKLQQRTYAFGSNLALEDNRQDFQVVEEFVRFGVSREEVLTYDEYGNVGEYYLKLAQEIEGWTEEDMQPTVCSWCGLCGYKDICPKYAEVIVGTDLDVRTPEDAANLAEKVYVDEARNKVAKEVLKVFAEERGAIVFGDQEYGPVLSENLKWGDLSEVLKHLDGMGLSMDEQLAFMSLTGPNLKKTLKKFAGLQGDDLDVAVAEIILQHGIVKPSQRFTFHKAKKED